MKKTKKIVLIISIIIAIMSLSQVYAENIDISHSVNLKDSIKRSSYNAILKANELSDEKYNLKDDIEIKVKNQKNSGSCWAFAFSSMLETSLAKQYSNLYKEFSPMHIEYETTQIFNRNLGSGAGPRLSIAYATSGYGPVEESQMPFDSVYDEQNGKLKSLSEIGSLDRQISARITETKEFASIFKKLNEGKIEYYSDISYTKQYESKEVESIRKLVKEHIKKYGAINADMYLDLNTYYNDTTASYNSTTYGEPTKVNHNVTIVGWDDTYSVDNFKDGIKPTNPGAYIVLNSYGDSFGKEGYMYISYEDAHIEQQLIGISELKEYEDGKKDYDKIYQYDEEGMNIGINIGKSSTAVLGNKYKREIFQDKDEYIQEVGLYIASTAGVEVYINPNDDNLDNAKLVTTSKVLETGYHTIKLPTPIKIENNKFAIKIKYINQEGVSIPFSMNFKEFYKNDSNKPIETSYFWDNKTSNEGESYILMETQKGEKWQDLYTLVVNSNNIQYSFKNSSACIKAFTTYKAKTSQEVEENETKTEQDEKKKETETEQVAKDTETKTQKETSNTQIDEETENPDDYIYKENIKNLEQTGINKDNTISNKILPATGKTSLIIIIIVVAIIGSFTHLKLKKLDKYVK